MECISKNVTDFSSPQILARGVYYISNGDLYFRGLNHCPEIDYAFNDGKENFVDVKVDMNTFSDKIISGVELDTNSNMGNSTLYVIILLICLIMIVLFAFLFIRKKNR